MIFRQHVLDRELHRGAQATPPSSPSMACSARPHQQHSLGLLVICLACCAVQQAAGASVNVSSSSELLAALQKPAVEQIVLLRDVAIGAEFDQFTQAAPLAITRNVTVTGPAGNSSSNGDDMPVLDMQNKVGVLQLCSSCTFSLQWITVANENRAGTGGGMTVFRGQQGSRVDWLGGIGLRPACPPTRPQLSLINATQRSSLFPSPPGGKQLVEVVNVTYKGRLYEDALKVVDLSSAITPQQLTNNSFTGGYAIRRRDAVRLCDHIVSAQCLQLRLPEDCIAELLAAGAAASSSTGSQTSSQQSTVAIAVPVAIAGLLALLAAAGLLLWHHRRQRKQQQRSRLPLAAAPGPDAGNAAGLLFGDPPDAYMQSGADQALQREGSRSLPSKQPSNISTAGQRSSSFSSSEHWRLVWSSSAGGADQPAWNPQDHIELGVLLGAGSFARVYKGRWSGLDVAVKVIHHGPESVSTVANEVQLMLGLNHPNIVRAYHCVTKQLVTAQQPSRAPPALPLSPASGPQHEVPGSTAAQPVGVQPGLSWGVEMTALQQDSSMSALLSPAQPSTPPLGTEATAAAATTAPGTGTGTGTGAGTRSSAYAERLCSSSFIQDLDAGPSLPAACATAYQRKGSLQQQRSQVAAVQGTPAAPTLQPPAVQHIASAATVGTAPNQQQQQQQQEEEEGVEEEEEARLSSAAAGSIGPGFAVMTLLPAASSSPGAAAAPSAAALMAAMLSCSTVSTTSTDSLKVPRSMSTLQGSAGPVSSRHVGSLGGGSAGSGPGAASGNQTPRATAAGSHSGLQQPGSGPGSDAAPTQPVELPAVSRTSLELTAPGSISTAAGSSLLCPAAGVPGPWQPGTGTGLTAGGVQSEFSGAAGRSSTAKSQQASSSGAAVADLSRRVSAGGGSCQSAAGSALLVAAAAAAAAGSGPSTLSSSSGPSRSSLGSPAWPLLMSSHEEGGGQGAYIATRNSAGSVIGGGDAGAWHGARDPAALVETWLVTELADRGTLARVASEWQPEASEEDMLRLLHLLRDVACGLKLLNSQNIVHADLNAHNVLVSSSPVARHGLVAKVADLGLSRILKQQASHRTTRTVGMLTHQPPELLRDGRMSPAVDIYSFGIMMYECFTRQAPYARMRYGQIYHQVVVLGARPAVPPDSMPEDYELLMRRCWSSEASERPTVNMLLECLDLMIQDRQEQQTASTAV